MSAVLPTLDSCCDQSCDTQTVQVPGPAGPAGADGANGTNGANAFTLTTLAFTMPAELGTVTVTVADSSPFGLGQVLFVKAGGAVGWFQVVTKPTGTTMSLKNLADSASGEYADNSPPTTVFAIGATVSPGGLQGPAGSTPAGAFLVANNLNEGTPADMRTSLALGSLAVLNTINGGNWSGTDLAVADGGTGSSTSAGARTNLGLVIGTDVEAHADSLTELVTAGYTANHMPWVNGSGDWQMLPVNAFGATIVESATALLARSTLGGTKRGNGIIGFARAVDLNVATTDTTIVIEATVAYRITKVVLTQATISLTTATVGLFTAAGGAGTTIAADQAVAGLTASTKYLELALQSITTTDVFTALTLYFRVGTPQGAAATADVYIFGEVYDQTI